MYFLEDNKFGTNPIFPILRKGERKAIICYNFWIKNLVSYRSSMKSQQNHFEIGRRLVHP